MPVFKFGILVFPATNCDQDALYVLRDVLKQDAEFVWHKDRDIHGYDCIVVPGGFSYGDYLRAGAIAQFSEVMQELKIFAERGGLVLGICNGFQILTESGLLPGAFLRNASLQFECPPQWVQIRTENVHTRFTNQARRNQVLHIPIAHGEGNYYCDKETLESLKKNRQIVFRYCREDGRITKKSNPNGSLFNIAGIVNEQGNVLGMMPHPERCSEEILGGIDGLLIWQSILAYVENKTRSD